MFIREIWNIIQDNDPKQYSSQMLIEKLAENCIGKSLHVLDLGCGDGKSIDWFNRSGLDHVWKGLDIDDSPEVKSRKRNDGDFYTFNGVEIPFNDSSFDIVFSHQVFEHVRHPEKLLREIHRVLKNNGVFFGSVSYLEPFHSYSIFNFTPYGWYRINIDNGFTPYFLAAGIDSLSLIRRSLRMTKPEDNLWACSPLNKEIIEDNALSIKEKNYKMLMNAGHMVFSSKKEII
jgi:SAM-dependent methyltransferase